MRGGFPLGCGRCCPLGFFCEGVALLGIREGVPSSICEGGYPLLRTGGLPCHIVYHIHYATLHCGLHFPQLQLVYIRLPESSQRG